MPMGALGAFVSGVALGVWALAAKGKMAHAKTSILKGLVFIWREVGSLDFQIVLDRLTGEIGCLSAFEDFACTRF